MFFGIQVISFMAYNLQYIEFLHKLLVKSPVPIAPGAHGYYSVRSSYATCWKSQQITLRSKNKNPKLIPKSGERHEYVRQGNEFGMSTFRSALDLGVNYQFWGT